MKISLLYDFATDFSYVSVVLITESVVMPWIIMASLAAIGSSANKTFKYGSG